jgi:hypothetical protein
MKIFVGGLLGGVMIKKQRFILFCSLLSFIGGIIWIWMGGQLSVLPPANTEIGYYRSSHFDIMPWLGFGLACIGIGFTGLYVLLPHSGRLSRLSFAVALIGCFIYFFGTLTRLSMDLSIEYDPIQPIGFIMAIIGLLSFSLSMLRSKFLPLYCRLLLLISAFSLLIFNDQYLTSWSSIPFGLSWIGLGLFLFLKFLGNSTPNLH